MDRNVHPTGSGSADFSYYTLLSVAVVQGGFQELAEVDLGFPVFLTAYDPSDLLGGSLDPLGFDRGYLLLADKILPGLTNVAARPRYFSILCAGAFLAELGVADPPRVQYQKRFENVLRFERFWALANVLASQDGSDEALSSSGIRGVTYASAKAGTLIRNGSSRTDSDFQLLSRQVPYGVSSVGEGLEEAAGVLVEDGA